MKNLPEEMGIFFRKFMKLSALKQVQENHQLRMLADSGFENADGIGFLIAYGTYPDAEFFSYFSRFEAIPE